MTLLLAAAIARGDIRPLPADDEPLWLEELETVVLTVVPLFYGAWFLRRCRVAAPCESPPMANAYRDVWGGLR